MARRGTENAEEGHLSKQAAEKALVVTRRAFLRGRGIGGVGRRTRWGFARGLGGFAMEQILMATLEGL
jgi:hypothetical protein